MLCLNVGTRVFLSPGVAHNSTYEMEFLEIIVSCIATDKRQAATGRLINFTSNPRAQRARNTDSDRLFPSKVPRFYLILSTTVYQPQSRRITATPWHTSSYYMSALQLCTIRVSFTCTQHKPRVLTLISVVKNTSKISRLQANSRRRCFEAEVELVAGAWGREPECVQQTLDFINPPQPGQGQDLSSKLTFRRSNSSGPREYVL